MAEIYVDEDEGGPKGNTLVSGILKWGGAALSLALLIGIGMWSWQLGQRDATEVPIIRAMNGPSKIQPEDPGGAQADHQGLAVNDVLAGQGEDGIGSVTTAPRDLDLAEEDRPAAELTAVAAPAPRPATLTDTGPAAGPDEDGVTAAPEETPDPNVLRVNRPIARPGSLNTSVAPTTAEDRARASIPQPQVATEADVPAGAPLVQLGAFESEAAARQKWDQLFLQHGDLLGARKRYVQRVDTASGAVLFRLRAAGFETGSATRAFCAALSARSIDCIEVVSQ